MFGKSTSLNMRNFSNVQIGSSDKIREVYERKAHEKVATSPNMYSSMKLSSGSEEVIVQLNPLMRTSIQVPASVNLSLQSNLNSSRNSKMTDSKTTK